MEPCIGRVCWDLLPFAKVCFKISGKLPHFCTIAENVWKYLRVNMNRADNNFHWNDFESTGFVFGSSLILFMILVSLNSLKVNISLLSKCFFVYSVIFVERDCVRGFTFIREKRLHGLQVFFSVRNTFRSLVAKVLLLYVS